MKTDEKTCQLNLITYCVFADGPLLNMDELNVHKRATTETFLSLFLFLFHNRTRAAQLLMETGTMLPAGHQLLQCKTSRLEKVLIVISI